MLEHISQSEYDLFYDSLAFTIAREGGYVNDPDDPGGETKWGISKRYHPDEDIKNLTPERAAEIYYEKYWVPSGACNLDPPLCTVVFDTAVLLGVNRAKEFFEQSDGDIGRYLDARRQYHIVKSKDKYKKGHLNRVAQLERYATLYLAG